ncbi:MAG TPA: phosphoribosylanthranilate isomerase [Thermomicrobiales bacterium]|nr:phosphoribosylanthranilate isomerase [Thermomicrobiales bacterium]
MSADRVFVKICGLRDAGSAQVAVDSGADALGFILAESRRQVTPDSIREIRRSLASCARDMPQSGIDPDLVGVVVNVGPDEISRIVSESGVDLIQLSGDESPEILDDLDVPAIKALRFPVGLSVDDALREVSAWLDGPHPARHVLVEGHTHGLYGGTGARADWSIVAGVAERYPVILAGGLDPENVSEAVAAVGPFGVDVSSGIETDGAKDHEKIRNFVRAARRA